MLSKNHNPEHHKKKKSILFSNIKPTETPTLINRTAAEYKCSRINLKVIMKISLASRFVFRVDVERTLSADNMNGRHEMSLSSK